jgi:putative tryptophan/tyrosine transport system substrate-binding protein
MKIRAALILALVLAVLLMTPRAAGAQQAGKVWRIGLCHVGLDHVPPSLDGLKEGLAKLGYQDGKNVRLDYRNLADEQAARVTTQQFVRDRSDLIVAFESQCVRAAQTATREVPVPVLEFVINAKTAKAFGLTIPPSLLLRADQVIE